jgi:hypothetical protein
VLVAHVCDPSFSEESVFEASQSKQFLRPNLKKPFIKKGGGVLVEWLKV